jgi:hypothetical protein
MTMRVVLAVVSVVVLLVAGGLVAWRMIGSGDTVVHLEAASGGSVTTGDGVVVRFAPGALTRDTDVHVKAVEQVAPPAGGSWVADPVDVTLVGGDLRTFATLTLPLRGTVTDGASVSVMSRDDDGVWTAEGGTVDAAGDTITTIVAHFSVKSVFKRGVDVAQMPLQVGKSVYSAIKDVTYEAPAPRCEPASQLWKATAKGDALKVCVTAGTKDRKASLRVVNNRLYGQFLQLRGYPAMATAQQDKSALVDNIWRMLGDQNRNYTYLRGKGTLELDLPAGYRLIDFVARPGVETVILQIVVDTAGVVYAPAKMVVDAIECVLALPVFDEVVRDRAYRRIFELAGAVGNCVSAAITGYQILKSDAPVEEEKAAKKVRDGFLSAWAAAMANIPTALETVIQGGLQGVSSQHVVAERVPITPRNALNEPKSPLPAAVAATQQRLSDAADGYRQDRYRLSEVVPRAGLAFGNAADQGQKPSLTLGQEPDPIAGPKAAAAISSLTVTPPLRWKCPESGRDGYVYGLADPELATYPGSVSALGFAAEATGAIREAARAARPYRICIDLDGAWSVFSRGMPARYPAADALRIEELAGEYTRCRSSLVSAFVPADSRCHSSIRADIDGDGKKDALMLYRRGADDWTARVVTAEGPITDLALPKDENPPVPFNAIFLRHADFDGVAGEEAAVTVAIGAHSEELVLLTYAGKGLTTVRRAGGGEGADRFRIDSSLSYSEGIGCADVDGDGKPEFLETGASFETDPATGEVVSAEGGWGAWSWKGTCTWR